MKRMVLLAVIALALATAARAGDGRPRLRLPGIVVTPHPAPDAPDLGTCLIECADRDDACVRRARRPRGLAQCRLRRSLCDGDCDRYGRSKR
jgi:hypothetical protein